MKRPPGIWMLLSAGVLWLSLQDVYGIRATALIFAKSTTTTPPAPVPNVTDTLLDAEVVTESNSESSNVTKPTLTGNPQIDYIHDPNLPKELNGYNLSSYPFYERVPDPEEIDFKCDGLHDGFYASITFKCQVYHHCLFGTRYDFLCANYTAFDQKTFICQFVSDVDCVGSKKFWHRNDALYQAATTTTPKPLNIYTTAPPTNQESPRSRGGGGKRRRPAQRRPQFDYYEYDDEYDDEYYDDRPRSRRRRPRPRPRPIYDEYEEEYDDEEYERRNRRPYNRRGGERRRNKNRNNNRDEVDEKRPNKKKVDEEERPNRQKNDEEERPNRKKLEEEERPNRKKSEEEERPNRKKLEEEERPNRKKLEEGERPNRRKNEDERPNRKKIQDEERKDDSSRNIEDRKKSNRDEDFDEYDSRPSRPRKGQRRPIEDDYDEIPVRENRPNRKENEEKAIVKPTTGTIYDRPRVAPRIKPPVPKHEATKYAYKPITKSTTSSFEDDYYDDYEEPINKKIETDPIKPKSSERKQVLRSKTKLDDEDDELTLTQKPKITSRNKNRNRTQFRPLADEKKKKTTTTTTTTTETSEEIKQLDEEYYDYEIEKMPSSTEKTRHKLKTTTSTKTPKTTTTTVKTTTQQSSNYKEQIVRIVKRPFLPSRGGNPYTSRGLQPVGIKAAEFMEQQSSVQKTSDNFHKTTPKTITKQNPRESYDEIEPQTRGGTRQRLEPQDREPQIRSSSRGKINEDIEPQNTADIADRQTIPEQSYEESKPLRSQFESQNRNSPRQHIASQNRANIKFEPQKPLETSAKITKFSDPITDNEDDFRPMQRPYHILRPNVINGFNGPRTTQKPKIYEKNPLDINEAEYDVTLNDALNPTLPNLPITPNSFNGFSAANDYTFSAFQRPRYVLGTSDNTYKQPVVRQRFETTFNSRDQYVAPSSDFKNFYTAGTGSKRGAAYYTTSY